MSDFVEWDGHAFRVAAIAAVKVYNGESTVYMRDNQCFAIKCGLHAIIRDLEAGALRTFFRTQGSYGAEYFVAFDAVNAVIPRINLHSRIVTAAADIWVPYYEGLVTFLEKRGKIHTRTWHTVREELDNRWSLGLLKLVGDREGEIRTALEQELDTLRELDCATILSWPPLARPVPAWETFGIPTPARTPMGWYHPGYATVRLEGE